jgi:MYXO-CTERM domain-containing protein
MLCDEAGQCVDEPDGCGDVSAKGECDGNTVVWCQGGVVESFDCEAQGKICGVKDDVGFTCIDPNACVPSCDAKICGDDGCGGTCGSCNVGSECLDGACVDPDPTDPTDPTDPVDPNDPSVNDGDKDKGENSGGCQTGSSPSPLPMAAWSLVLLLVLGLRRRRNSKS